MMKNCFFSVKKSTRLSLLLCLTLIPVCLMAQDVGMNELKIVLGKLKALRTYSYETTTLAVFPNGDKDKGLTTVYMDATRQRLAYKTKSEELLLTGKWAYKADHVNKTVSVFDVVRYNNKYKKVLPELAAIFKNNLAAAFMDSVIIKSGKVKSVKKKGNLTTFEIGFSKDLAVEEMTIVYDNAKQLPESIYIRSFFPGDASGSRNRGTLMESTSKGYSVTVPESAFDPSRYFRIQGGKVMLTQFKTYKITSIL